MVSIGRNVPNPPDAGFGNAPAGQMRASKTGSPSSPFWVEALGVRVGRRSAGGNVTGSLGAFSINGDGSLGARLARTPEFTISVVMEDNAGGNYYLVDVEEPFLCSSAVAVAFLGEVNGYTLGQDNAGAVMYRKDGQSTIPTSWGSSSTESPEGTISVALIGETNVKPNTPTSRTPSGGTTGDFTPTFAFDFRDDNEALSGHAIGEADHVTRFRLRVKQGGATKWYVEGSPTPDEVAARRITRVYAGSNPLVAGPVSWSCATRDAGGLWSTESSELTFTISTGAGSESLAPVGNITDDTPDFQSRYTNGGATNSTHVQHKLTQSGVNVDVGDQIARVVTPGSTTIVTWAQSGFQALNPGQQYRLHTRFFVGSDDSGWDEGVVFRLDARPNSPTNLSPPNGAIRTSLQTLRFLATDVIDLPGDTLTGEVELVDGSDDSLIGIFAATWNPASGRFEHVLTSGEIPTFMPVKWRPRGVDPIGPGAWGPQYILNYTSGPQPVITDPVADQVLTTNTYVFTYTVTGGPQVRRRVRIWEEASGVLIYDPGEELTDDLTFTVPAGPLRDSVGAYFATVEVWDSLNISGESAAVHFIVDVPSPSPLDGVTVAPVSGKYDPPTAPSMIGITWIPPLIDPADGDFGHYLVYRALEGASSTEWEVIASISNAEANGFIDTRPPSGVDLVYVIEYTVIIDGGEEIMSEPVSGTARVDLLYTILSDIDDGHENRVVMRYWSDRGVRPMDNRQIVATWSQKPIQIVDDLDYRVVTGTWRLTDEIDTGANALDLVDSLYDLRKLRADRSPRIICYRDPRGTFLFGVFSFEDKHGQVVPDDITATITEVDWSEGV